VKADAVAAAATLPADAAAKSIAGGATVIDLRASADYRRAHVPGAVWSIRPRVVATVRDRAKPVILVADDARVAALAATELREGGVADVKLLDGGMAAWQAGGTRKVEATPDNPPDRDRIDFVFHTLGRNEGNLDAARAYLKWEIDLTEQLDAQERGSFRL
jgi:rhodanese-related sulfurtransferase